MCGSASTYGNRSCRCDACRAAQKIEDQQKHLKNREERLAQQRVYRSANRDKDREKSRQWAANNRDVARARTQQWVRDNPEQHRLNRRKTKARRKLAPTIPFTADQWMQKRAYWADRCYLQIPGICNGNATTMDHVKPLAKGGIHMLANLRPACSSCNTSKNDRWPWAITLAP